MIEIESGLTTGCASDNARYIILDVLYIYLILLPSTLPRYSVVRVFYFIVYSSATNETMYSRFFLLFG